MDEDKPIHTESWDEEGRRVLTVKTPKRDLEYIISKSNDGFSFYAITTTKGVVPTSLNGKYLTPESALKVLTDYFKTVKYSTAAMYIRNHKNDTKRSPKGS